ncbi:hypothetical protein [Pseudomonas fluorescens]|uniref:hypothetical protein n=1 Tax=Pseudomonas fluorescens TaxID=294 RepID=UPI00124062A2|nr:hypothetical protein [Pseudomonas fluorescens]VVN47390.1 hypothetical protein PS639_05886 [Pseudomonas fluorescens]
MNNSDFEYDHDLFQRALVTSAGGYKRAKECLLENIDHWQRTGSELLMGNLSLAIHESGDLITGEVLGRKFNIHVAPFVDNQKGYAEVIVSTPRLSGSELNECCRFLIAANGSVLTSDKEELLAWDDRFQSYRFLIAVTRRVIGSPVQV